ncbi:MAG: hypothetical protein ABI591_26940 [Kofleriaceae bacterium]
MSEGASQAEVDALRANLDEKLAELKRRAVHVKEVLTPATYLESPWVRVGIAAAVGFALGAGARRDGGEGLFHSILRAGLSSAGVVAVQKLLTATKPE